MRPNLSLIEKNDNNHWGGGGGVMCFNVYLSIIPNTDNSKIKVRKRAKIKNQYNQTLHMIQDTNGKVTTSQ